MDNIGLIQLSEMTIIVGVKLFSDVSLSYISNLGLP
jgi:hypothetical protein